MRRRALLSTVYKSFNENNYLTIEALEDGLNVRFDYRDCEYCIDGDGEWKTLKSYKLTPDINTGQKLHFRLKAEQTTTRLGTFVVNKNFNLKGNVMSMLYGDDGYNNFSLKGTTAIFKRMFEGCTTLQSVSPGFLPATTLGKECYRRMFDGCTSLKKAPDLPALDLIDYCYEYMFYGCSSLSYIKAMFLTKPDVYKTGYWVNGVASSGTFVKNEFAEWNVVGVNGVPKDWTIKYGENEYEDFSYTLNLDGMWKDQGDGIYYIEIHYPTIASNILEKAEIVLNEYGVISSTDGVHITKYCKEVPVWFNMKPEGLRMKELEFVYYEDSFQYATLYGENDSFSIHMEINDGYLMFIKTLF